MRRRTRGTGTMSKFSTRLLDSDGEVQASLVVAQLERRRPHAFAHSRRVAALAVQVAQLARLPEAEVRQIYWGVPGARHRRARRARGDLRDAGPARDGRARGRRRSTPRSARAGSRPHPGCRRSCRTPRWHHERFDGTGYPDGRGGHEVPLTVALVDGVRLLGRDDRAAARTASPARPTTPPDEMQRSAGRQWSRVLVDWLLETVGVAEPRSGASRLTAPATPVYSCDV